MHIIQTSVRRPVATAMFYIAVILVGVVSLLNLSVDLLPDVAYPRLSVWTTYHDVAPAEVEQFVTVPIEEAVSTVPGVRQVTSVSREGVSLVTLQFLWGTDMDIAALNVREKLDNLRWRLPHEAGRPTILRLDPRSQPVLSLAVTGSANLVALKQLTENVIKRRLEQIDGVALATVTGGLEREIHVDVNTGRLSALGLTVEQISQALAAANYNLPGGTIKKGRYRYALRTLGEFQSVDEIGSVIVGRSAGGGVVSLKDVADIEDAFKERQAITRYNGREAIGVIITKEAGANTVEVSRRVRRVLAQLREQYPEVRLAVAADQADFISASIQNVLQAIVYGGILAFLVLFLFLHDLRNPVHIALSIPIAILATFALMYFSKISLNMMSLGGLALGVGMLVDNSIVVLENIFRHRQEGEPPAQAAVAGTQEVVRAVTASTLTTVAVFFPIIYVHGVAGQLFRDQSLTVTFSLLASLLVAVTLLPMMAARGGSQVSDIRYQNSGIGNRELGGEAQEQAAGRGKLKWGRFRRLGVVRLLGRAVAKVGQVVPRTAGWMAGWVRALLRYWGGAVARVVSRITEPVFDRFDRLFGIFASHYERALEWSLDHRGRVLGLALAGLLLAGLLSLTIPRELMPHVDQGRFRIDLQMPPGSTLEATSEAAAELERLLLRSPDIEDVFTSVGVAADPFAMLLEKAAADRATLEVRLKKHRRSSSAQLMARFRRELTTTQHRLGDGNVLAGAEITLSSTQTTLQQVLGMAEADVAIEILGNDLRRTRVLAEQVRQRLTSVPGLGDLHSNYQAARPEIHITMDRERVSRFGLSAAQVARFIQNRMRGNRATQFKDFDRKIDVLVRPQSESRDELRDLLDAQLPVARSARLTYVPLRHLVEVQEIRGPTEIHRRGQVREIVLFGNIQGRSFSRVVGDIEARLSHLRRPAGVQVRVAGQREEMVHSFHSLMLALVLAAALVYMILAAQFESLLHPFIIILAVPLASIGVVLALFLTRQTFNVMSLIGAVVLVGIVVNDAIVKVDFINQERRRGLALRSAILEAGRKRLRPIVMTTVTTVFGLAPMALGLGAGAELRRPLAMAIIGGLLSATFLTLIVVPVVYAVFTGKRGRLRK